MSIILNEYDNDSSGVETPEQVSNESSYANEQANEAVYNGEQSTTAYNGESSTNKGFDELNNGGKQIGEIDTPIGGGESEAPINDRPIGWGDGDAPISDNPNTGGEMANDGNTNRRYIELESLYDASTIKIYIEIENAN